MIFLQLHVAIKAVDLFPLSSREIFSSYLDFMQSQRSQTPHYFIHVVDPTGQTIYFKTIFNCGFLNAIEVERPEAVIFMLCPKNP